MIFERSILGQQIVLLLSIAAAIGLAYAYLRWRHRLSSLRSLWLPLSLFTLFGTLDALVTVRGTWNAPWREGNPAMRAFLVWGGWIGQCVGSAVWIVGWTLVLDGLESLRLRLAGRWAALVGWLRLWTAYALALGHLNGFASWGAVPGADVATRGFFVFLDWLWAREPGLFAISPFGYPLYAGLFFGGLCALLHAATAAALRRVLPQPSEARVIAGKRAMRV